MILQQWEGIVIDIKDTYFSAKLYDLTNGGTYEIAENIPNNKVSIEDIDLFQINSIFIWTLYENKSEFKFLRI